MTKSSETRPETARPGEGRRAHRTHARLAAYLTAQPPEHDRVLLSFVEIERVLGERLPSHADSPYWWNNEGVTAQSRAWLSSGWMVASIDKSAKAVEFVRREGWRR